MTKAKYGRQLSVSLSKQIISQIRALANQTEISMASWIRKAIEQALKTESTQKTKDGGQI